jgi:hypothetical protein
MATDNTPPRLKLIVTIAVITVVTLVSLNFVFASYYAVMTDEAVRSKLAPTTDFDRHHKAELDALAAAKIDQAMSDVAKGARATAITPQPSDDLGSMTGWSKLPKPAPTPEPTAVAPAPETMMVGDAGAMTADGGPLTTGDAGAGGKAAGDAGAKPAADAGAHAHGHH